MKHRSKIFVWILIAAIVVFQISSFVGTSNAMKALWGNPLWSYLLAFGLVAVDFGSVGKLFSHDLQEVMEKEGGSVTLFVAWSVTALAEAFLIFLNFRLGTMQNTNHIMITSGTISQNFMQWTMPAMMAVFYWMMQTGVVISIDRMVNQRLAGAK